MIPHPDRPDPAILEHRHPLAKTGLRRGVLAAAALLAGAAALAGCQGETRYMKIGDLTPGELLYVQRVVVLERAKAVALVDRKTGDALLDSLAVAWGDSSLEQTLAGAPAQPARAVQVNDLLNRVLAAERDSLVLAPRPDRLAAPLPDPYRPPRAPGTAAEPD